MSDYIVRATGKKIFLNSQWEFTTESQLISKKNVWKNSKIFEAANEADAQEVADAINKLIKDRWQTLVEWQTITELAEAKPIYNEKNWLWRIEIPQIEMIKQHNNWVELTQQLNKCKTYEELTNIRDGTLTWKELLKRFNAYRDTYINWLDALPKNIDPRKFFPAEFIEPAKWRTSSWTTTWRTTTRKSNIHKILDSK